MQLVIIFGPQAVGKMTIGQELEKITNLKLFHNHMTIELVTPFFSYGTDTGRKLVNLFRQKIFEEVAQSDLPGLIFTYVWDFDSPSDTTYIHDLCGIFSERGTAIYFVELEAPQSERLQRNTTQNRLHYKPTKRNIEQSEQRMLTYEAEHRCTSLPGEITHQNYLRIDTTHLTPQAAAHRIQQTFSL